MRTIHNAFRMLLCLLSLSVVLLLECGSSEAAERIGAFSKVEGQVDVMRGGALPAVPAKMGDTVHVGDFIRTKSNARAEVTFSDGNLLKIAQRSRIDISEYLAAGSGDSRKFNLPRGKVQAVVTKGSPTEKKANRFEIHTPNAVAGVRGTEFFVFHDRNVTGILVKEGSVYAFNPKVPQNVVTIPAGTVTTVSEKGAPQPPRPATDAEKRNAEKETTVSQKSGPAAESPTAESAPAAAAAPSTQGETGEVPVSGDTAAGTDMAPVTEASDTASPAGTTAEPSAPPAETMAYVPLDGPALVPSDVPNVTPQIEPPKPEPPVIIVPPTETFPEQTLNPVNFTLTSTPAQFSNSATVTFSMSDPSLTYIYSLDGGASQPFTGSISGLGEGSHTIEFIGQDAAGNSSKPVPYTWTVDMTAPTVTLTGTPAAITNNAAPAFSLSSSETGVTYSIRIDGGTAQPYASGSSLLSLAEGPHSVEIIAADAAGNTSGAVSYGWTVDTTAPSLSLTGSPASVSSATAPAFTLSSEAGVTYSIRVDGGAAQPYTSGSPLPSLAEGAHSVEISATDVAGNISTPVSYGWTIDITAPVLSLTGSPAAVTNATAPAFTLSSEVGVTYSIRIDGGAAQTYTSGTTLLPLSDGAHVVEITATDSAGNSSTAVSYSWTIDTVAPVLTIAGPPLATSTLLATSYSVTSSESGSHDYRVDGGAWNAFTGSVPTLAEGTHLVEFRTTDLAGNTSTPVSTNLFVGSRTIHFDGTMSGMPGGVLALPGRLYEYSDKSAAAWEFLTSGSGTPTAALNIAAGGRGDLDGTILDGYWQISSTATASGGVISGGLNYTYLGFDRLVSNTSGTITGSYDASGWSLSAGGTAMTGYASPLGFAAEIKTGSMHRDSTIDTNSNLLTIIGHGAMDGLLGAPAGLWSATSAPFTLLGVYQGPDTSNSYWQGNIQSHKYSTVGLASPDGATFSGFVGGANIDTAGTTAGNLSALYVAPRSGGGFGAGIINGSFSGNLGSGFWGGSGVMERFELNSSLGVDPATMPDDWWTTNTFTANPPVATGPVPVNQDNDISAEGFLMDGSLNMTSELEDRGDVLRLTAFVPDPTFGVWQRESFGSFTGSNSDLVLITNTADGAVVNGKLVPDNIFNIVSLGGWGASGDITGRAYGLWGDWAAGETRLLSGVVNGSYNAGLGTFGAITTGAWLDVNRFLGLTSTERQQTGFPGLQEFSFSLSGNNGIGGSVSLTNIRTFSHAAGDPLSLWATDAVTGTFSGTVPEGEQIAVSDGSGEIRGSFRLEHGGTSGGSDVWLAEINGLGEATGPFRSSFNGVAAGTWSGSTFTGTAAGITHPITYYSSFGSTNLLKRYDGASGYQFAGALHGVFGGLSLWSATDLLPSDFEIAGVHTPSVLPNQDYIFTTSIDSFDIPAGSATTVDGGAYSGYMIGSFATGFTYPEEPIDGRIATLYAAPDGTAGILAGKFDGYVDLTGVWESRGDWFPVELVSTPGSVSPTAWSLLSSSLPLNVAQAGSFTGAGGGSISTVASISGNALDRTWISSLPWGVWRLTTSGTYTGPTYNDWQYGMHADDGSFAFTAEMLGDRWETAPPPPATPFVGKLHGIVGGSWVDMTPTVPVTGILIGETVGTFDPNASRWQAVAAGAFMETNAFLQMASTAAGQVKLQQLNIPAFEIGAADFSGSGTNGTDSISVAMNGVKFFAPTAGGRPVIWATGTVSGTYAGNPVAVSNVTLSGSSATVSGLAPNFTVQNWGSNKWQASITDTSGAGTVGGHSSIQIKGMGAGSYTGTGSGTLSGTANGSVR